MDARELTRDEKKKIRSLVTGKMCIRDSFVAVMILTNTFNIVLAVFDVSQHVIQQSAGIIQNLSLIHIFPATDTDNPPEKSMDGFVEVTEQMELPF